MSEEFNKEVNRENAADETVHTETSESVQKRCRLVRSQARGQHIAG